MAIVGLSFPTFNIRDEPSSVGTRWAKWISRFQNFLVANGISDGARKRALLLLLSGEEVHDIFDALPNTSDVDTFEQAVDKLTAYFTPKKNLDYETLLFRQAKQRSEETVDSFVTRLRQLASTCEFYNVEREIKTQLLHTCTSSSLRRKALRTPNASLEDILNLSRTLALAEVQAETIEQSLKTEQQWNKKVEEAQK